MHYMNEQRQQKTRCRPNLRCYRGAVRQNNFSVGNYSLPFLLHLPVQQLLFLSACPAIRDDIEWTRINITNSNKNKKKYTHQDWRFIEVDGVFWDLSQWRLRLQNFFIVVLTVASHGQSFPFTLHTRKKRNKHRINITNIKKNKKKQCTHQDCRFIQVNGSKPRLASLTTIRSLLISACLAFAWQIEFITGLRRFVRFAHVAAFQNPKNPCS